MANKKATELRGLSDTELQKRLNDAREELFKLRFQKATKQLTNTNRISEVRHDVARIETMLREHAGQA